MSRPRPRRRSGRAHDVAIYAPFASLFYGSSMAQSGGAELQTTLLAGALAERGLRVAHIVYPVRCPRPLDPPAPTLVERAPWRGDRRLGELAEGAAIWRSMARADARAYVIRGGGGHVAPAAAFCRARRRRLVFSASIDLDFDFERRDRKRWLMGVYRLAVRRADRIVVQTGQQGELARRALPDRDPLLIPSFAQPAEPAAGEPRHFLWSGRIVDYKLPERYVELAEALPEARFLMVATAPSDVDRERLELVRAAGRRLPNLEVLPERPRKQVLEEISRAAAVVTTSRAEGMPNTFLEAWARGVPALSLHVDPDGRIASHGLGIAAGGSMERLIEGAAALWDDRALREELGGRARDFVREVHSPDAVGGRWGALLDELL